MAVEVLNTNLSVGLERFAFLLKDPNGSPIRDGAATVKFSRLIASTGQEVQAANGEALYFGMGMPDGGSWVAYTSFDASGPWNLEVSVTRADGWQGTVKDQVEVLGGSELPRAGMLAPVAALPKADPGADLAALTSDEKPVEALYTGTLAEAKAAGKAAVVLFSSPGNCRAAVCQATLDAMKSVQAQLGSRATFIHVESRDMANPAELSAAAKSWGLPGELWLFVIDPRGSIVARAEGGVDADEMGLLTRMALGESVTKPQ
jgi:hypothetical protein